MDPKTCKSLINNIKIQRHEPIILYRTFKYVIEQILFYQIQHDNCHQWIECLENFPFDCILWNEDKFYTLLVLLISITEKWCQDCLMVWKSVFSNETIQDVIKKYLPRLLEQNRQLDVFEWKCLRNYSHYIIFPRSIQRSILTLIRDTIESYREVFEESSSIKIDAQVIFIIESAVHILFNISKNDAGSITSICQQNVRSLIQFTMTLNGNSGQYKNNEETFDEQSSLRKLRQVEKNSALRIWKKSFSCNLTSFAVNCLMNQVVDLLLPSQSSSIGFSLNESFTLFQHRHLGLQLTSLALIYFYLQNDLDHLKTISNTPISSKSSSSITPVVSAVKAGKKLKKQSKIEKESPSNSDKKSAVSSSSWVYHPQTVIEICQNGYLRQLCWCLIHPQAPIRSLALKIMKLFQSILYFSSNLNESLNYALLSLKQIWVISFIEQGLVPVLEWIATGIPLYGKKSSTAQISQESIFPEDSVRSWATTILHLIIEDLQTNSVAFLQNRLYLAVMHTNSSKLRCNIICGLYFLASRSSRILRWMRCPEPDDPSTSLFNKLFKELSYSGSQANHQIEHITDLLRLLFFFFRSTSSLFSHKTQSNQTVLPTDASFHPPVYVLDTSSPIPGTLTQIDYPSLSILAQQSPALAMMILQSKTGSNPCILPGSYDVWQELFSHLSNDHIMNNAFKEATLSLEMILNLFTISSKFDISTLLSAYTTHIISRISKKNVIFILQYLLLSQDTPSTRSNDLIILSHCLDVLISSLKIIMTNSRQDIRQLLILQEIFVKLFEIPLNSSSEDESTPLL